MATLFTVASQIEHTDKETYGSIFYAHRKIRPDSESTLEMDVVYSRFGNFPVQKFQILKIMFKTRRSARGRSRVLHLAQ